MTRTLVCLGALAAMFLVPKEVRSQTTLYAGARIIAGDGMAYEVTTEADSRTAVQELAARQVDIVKIRVDDRNGRAPKLSAALRAKMQ